MKTQLAGVALFAATVSAIAHATHRAHSAAGGRCAERDTAD